MSENGSSSFPVPRVVVSKCLGFASCRYNGQTIRDRTVQLLEPFAEFIPVCPEVDIGLGIPRDPIRLIEEEGGCTCLYQPATGRDVSEEMQHFIEGFFSQLERPDGFILKSRSPSCGPWNVKSYRSKENPGAGGKGAGLFGRAALERYPGVPVEEEGRLKNFSIREHFLASLFNLARFRALRREGEELNSLIGFHTVSKLLFMAYNQSSMRRLGRITANHEKLTRTEVWDAYEKELIELFSRPPKYTNMINAFQHAFGGLSQDLEASERQFFLRTIEEYRDERIPAGTVLHLLRSWAIRFDNGYLLEQSLLEPYPLELLEISDSGKGRDY